MNRNKIKKNLNLLINRMKLNNYKVIKKTKKGEKLIKNNKIAKITLLKTNRYKIIQKE